MAAGRVSNNASFHVRLGRKMKDVGITWNNKDVHRPNALIIIGRINIWWYKYAKHFLRLACQRDSYNRSINYEEKDSPSEWLLDDSFRYRINKRGSFFFLRPIKSNMYIHIYIPFNKIIISIRLQSKSDSRILSIFHGLRAMVARKRGWQCVFVSHERSLSSQFLLRCSFALSRYPRFFSFSGYTHPQADRQPLDRNNRQRD